MKLEPGTVIERYTVQSLLGAGGTAMVYKVFHTKLNTLYALKVLTITSSSIRDRMLREGQLQASLKHLNVVNVTDVLDVDGNPGLIMEYVEGPSLEVALQKYKLSNAAAETLFRGVVAGVRHAHDQGLVHRDLKPANVLLAESASGYIPKVTDFGLAKAFQGEDASVANTRSGIAMGTPSFMAPEQIRDAATVDRRADVFSLGCILYELVTRRRAFPGDEALQIYNAICAGSYGPPRNFVEDLPDRIDQAIRGSLITDRDHRIPDCATLIAVLDGERTWDCDPIPTPQQDPASSADTEVNAPPALVDAPDLPVAARGPRGETPGAVPPRRFTDIGASAGIGLSHPGDQEEEITVPAGIDMTLTPVETAKTTSEAPRPASTGALTFVLVGAVSALILAAVLLAVGGLVASVVIGPPQSRTEIAEGVPSRPTKTVTIERPDAETVSPESAPVGATPAPSPVPVARTTPVPRPAPVVATPKPESVVAPAPPRPETPSNLTVRMLSNPKSVRLEIDGADRGRTPAKLDLSPGVHRIALTSGEGAEEQRETFLISVEEGADNKWCYSFPESRVHKGSCPR